MSKINSISRTVTIVRFPGRTVSENIKNRHRKDGSNSNPDFFGFVKGYCDRLFNSSNEDGIGYILSQSIDMPYTTLLSMLKNGLGGASLNHVFQICRGLEITVDQLQSVLNELEMIIPFCINAHEKQVVTQYRNLPEMQAAGK